jgi:hypothetical protein
MEDPFILRAPVFCPSKSPPAPSNRIVGYLPGERRQRDHPPGVNALRSRPYPADLRDGHGLAGVELSAGRAGHLNELARSQVMEYCFRVVGRTDKQSADHADALRVQRMVVLQPTEVDERVTDLLFLIRRHTYSQEYTTHMALRSRPVPPDHSPPIDLSGT